MQGETPEELRDRAVAPLIDSIRETYGLPAVTVDEEIAADLDAIRAGTFVPAPEPESGGF